jgi:hypothetical protein
MASLPSKGTTPQEESQSAGARGGVSSVTETGNSRLVGAYLDERRHYRVRHGTDTRCPDCDPSRFPGGYG